MQRMGAAFANYFIAIGVLILGYGILRFYTSRQTSIIFSVILLLGGTLPYYLFRRPLMSHGAEAFYFLLAVYAIECLKRRPDRTLSYIWAGIGMAGVLLTRFQDAAVIGVMGLLLAYDMRFDWRRLLLLVGTATLVLAFQLYVNWLNFDRMLVSASDVVAFMTPFYLLQFGWVQAQRLFHLFFGLDWGLFLMFPWLFFALCVSREELCDLWRVSKSWLIGSLMSLLLMANYTGHGASYGHRYVNLFILAATFVSALGFERAQKGRGRKAVYAVLGLMLFVSWTHYAAFESNESSLTLSVGNITEEGPARKEWLDHNPSDWVNGHYSRNVYALFAHPNVLLQKFVSAPLPLYLAAKAPAMFHRSMNPMVGSYITRHQINFNRFARFALLVFLGNVLCFLALRHYEEG